MLYLGKVGAPLVVLEKINSTTAEDLGLQILGNFHGGCGAAGRRAPPSTPLSIRCTSLHPKLVMVAADSQECKSQKDRLSASAAAAPYIIHHKSDYDSRAIDWSALDSEFCSIHGIDTHNR